MQTTTSLLIYIFIVQTVCFFIKGLAGFGDPLLSNPLLSIVLDNKTISPLNLFLGAPINGFIAWKNRKAFSLRQTIPIAICVMCGVIPGTLMLKYFSSWLLKAGLGIVILLIGIEMLTREKSKAQKANPVVMVLISFFSGLTAGLYGITLFFVAYMERTTDNRSAFRGNICFIFFIENIFRILVYSVYGIITPQVLFLLTAAFPGAILGFYLGTRVDKRLSEKNIRQIITSLFMFGGASVLIRAIAFKA